MESFRKLTMKYVLFELKNANREPPEGKLILPLTVNSFKDEPSCRYLEEVVFETSNCQVLIVLTE